MEAQPNIRVLKAVVIILGLLIILSVTVIAVTLYRRMNPPAPPPAVAVEAAPGITPAPSVAAEPPAQTRPFGDHKVELPAGARLIETRMVGDRMFLRARLLGGNEVWVVLSLVTGQRLGSFELGTAAE